MTSKQEDISTYVITGDSQILFSRCYVEQGCTNTGC